MSLPTWDPPTGTSLQAPTLPLHLTCILADVRVWTDAVEAEGLLLQIRHPHRPVAKAPGPPAKAEARR